jgi:hypothetical protein
VDQDPRVDVLITSIEDGIRSAAVCLADITMDNPNVWFELGFAIAANRPVVMVCSNERTGKYPFDIQHRAVIPYKTEAQSDFQELADSITERLKVAAERGVTLEQIAEASPVAPLGGLSTIEVTLLAVTAGSANPGDAISIWSLRIDAEKAGLSNVGISLALRRLIQREFLDETLIRDQDEPYKGVVITPDGWNWIDFNEELFTLLRAPRGKPKVAEVTDEDIPF